MARRASRSRRSAAEWGVRGVLAFAAMTLGYLGVTRNVADVVRARDPARAHRLAPGDGRITGILAETLLMADPADAPRAERLARSALRQNAMAIPAVVTLGLVAQSRGEAGLARRLLAYSERLSRRDQQTQILGIEDAVARNDIPGALRHYDIALRTSRTSPDLLFPVLAAASAEPPVMAALVRTLAGRPFWGDSFIEYVAGSGPDPRATARLLRALRRTGVPVSDHAQAVTVTRLISHDALEDAWSFYAASHPGADRRMSRDPRFVANLADPSPFDWILGDETGVTVTIQRGEAGGILDFSAPGSVGGLVAQQVQMLPPGDYSLSGHSVGIDLPDAARPYWTLVCRDDRELNRVTIPNSSQSGGVFSGRFRVPAGCPVQRLVLTARPSDTVSGVSGQIDRIQLRPIS